MTEFVRLLEMNFLPELGDAFVEVFLTFPVCCSLAFCIVLYILYPVYYEKADAARGWRWILSCATIFVLLSVGSTFLIPVLSLAPDRIIFRPTPSCSTFDRPARYICLTLDDQRQSIFYTTTWRTCNSSDPNMGTASKFYVISSWIPSPDHFVTIKSVEFQPESSPVEKKESYRLPENYCVRAAGPIGGEQQKVAFYSINGTRHHLLDSGYIKSSLLKKFFSGWYRVSSCKTGLSRWFFNCTNGFVSTKYVRLPEYTRIILHEGRVEDEN